MPTRERIEAMLASEPDDVFLNYARACALVGEGRLDEAVAGFDRVIALDANYVPAYFQKGQALAKADDTDAARETLHTGIDVARRVGDSHAMGEMTEFLAMLDPD